MSSAKCVLVIAVWVRSAMARVGGVVGVGGGVVVCFFFFFF